MRASFGRCLAAWMLFVTPAEAEAQATPTLRVSEVRAGMRGYGLTVFRGTEPERFEVEVIAVMRNFLPRQDVILIRCTHPTLDHTGIVGGMSGSPIFLEGKLAGALAYGWRFAKDPIAGVTPIESMLDVWRRPLRGMPRALLGPTLRRQSVVRDGAGEPQANSTSPWPLPPPDTYFRRFDPHSELSPAVTPLLLGGFSTRARRLLEDILDPYGFVPLQAGSSGGRTRVRPPGGPNPFVPGGAIGVQLMRGDIDGTSIGTITHVEGNRFLAFGHPMFNTGEQYFPVTTARIHTFLASLERSNKIGDPIEEVGSLTQDRQSCIAGDVSKRARMVPFRIHLRDRTLGREDTFSVEIAQHRFLTPALAFGAAFDAVSEAMQDEADATLTLRGRIEIPGHRTLDLEDSLFSESGLSNPGALLRSRTFSAMNLVLQNPFEEVGLARVNLDIDVRYERGLSEIRAVYVTSDELVAGERVNAYVVHRPLGGAEEVRTLAFVVPEEAAGQTLEIEVASGSAVQPEVAEPRNLEDLLENLTKAFPATSLVLSLKVPSQGVTLTGHVVRALPNFALDTLRPAASSESATPFAVARRTVIPEHRVLSGAARVRVRVRRIDD